MVAAIEAIFLEPRLIEIQTPDHVRIVVTSEDGKWEGRYDFYPDRWTSR